MTGRLDSLKEEVLHVSCEAYAVRARWPLRRQGGELVGECPRHGSFSGKSRTSDRFAINPHSNKWNCRHEEGGGDVISLVRHVQACGFVEALEIITGRDSRGESQPVGGADPEREQREREARREGEKLREKREANARQIEAREREEARKAGWAIWKEAFSLAPGSATKGSLRPASGGRLEEHPVFDYFRARGILSPTMAPERRARVLAAIGSLRFAPALAYRVRSEKHGWITAHEGPCMLACVQQRDGRFGAVHRTWLDLSNDGGKAEIHHPETGELMPAKKMLGTKRGGAIRLHSPPAGLRREEAAPGSLREPAEGFHTLVIGEGIETVLSVLGFGSKEGEAYWAASDLGNLAGRCARVFEPARSGPGQPLAGAGAWRLIRDEPDMGDEDAFLPPEGLSRILYLGDGDSNAAATWAALTRGARRAMLARPGLKAEIAWAPPGSDFNDLVRPGGQPSGGAGPEPRSGEARREGNNSGVRQENSSGARE